MKKIVIVLGVVVLVSLFIPAVRETVFLVLLAVSKALALVIKSVLQAVSLVYEAIKDTFLRLVRHWI